MKLRLLQIVFIVISKVTFSQSGEKSIVDSIIIYNQSLRDRSELSMEDRLKNANRSKHLSFKLGIDSLILKSNKNLSALFWDTNQFGLYKQVNFENSLLSQKLNDSLSLAETYANLGRYYRVEAKSDSAYHYYFKAEKLYKGLDERFHAAFVLLRIALIQKDEKDFGGSEVTSINALSLLESLDENDDVIKLKSFIFNSLGMVFNQLEQFDESISYHQKALELKNKLDGNNMATIDNSKNNLANTYKNAHKFDLALMYYNQILDNKNLINERPDFYALVLDNYAHTLYLSNNRERLPKLYLKALKIADSIEDRSYNSIIINQHLAEFYNNIENQDSAKYYAYRAKDISKEYHNDDLLKSLLLLSKIEEDSLAVKHFNEYITLNDSLQKNERKLRNKYARIRFETQQIEAKNVKITKQRMWLTVISIILVIASLMVYIIITQRNKNKELKFIQKQQETNEEIYNLMLSQNESIEEARALEKKRISQELHDGVLGRLFGTRLNLDSLNMGSTKEAIQTREQYIAELKTIEEDIRKVSHELNTDFVSGSGFIDIIKTLVETQTNVYKLSYNLEHDETINWDQVSNKNKIHIYRIVQESLHNIYKHADAKHVNISFKLKNDVICFTITDDGSGFDVNKAKSGIGLKNMNSRINEINGKIHITSEKNEGTTVTIEIPLT
ncbi:tetratricopeptide repeat-containing sensor histidine kinase [Changchengzhania lutea]|uniref:tetratricopeptide repeat-containing sensor histidine kinase n=1 Tax=Changchengzhania lutea TaxID=2049305 RepID=UPI00115D0F5C|nr:sensor histidine kinase [Changchengzhania lutea]